MGLMTTHQGTIKCHTMKNAHCLPTNPSPSWVVSPSSALLKAKSCSGWLSSLSNVLFRNGARTLRAGAGRGSLEIWELGFLVGKKEKGGENGAMPSSEQRTRSGKRDVSPGERVVPPGQRDTVTWREGHCHLDRGTCHMERWMCHLDRGTVHPHSTDGQMDRRTHEQMDTRAGGQLLPAACGSAGGSVKAAAKLAADPGHCQGVCHAHSRAVLSGILGTARVFAMLTAGCAPGKPLGLLLQAPAGSEIPLLPLESPKAFSLTWEKPGSGHEGQVFPLNYLSLSENCFIPFLWEGTAPVPAGGWRKLHFHFMEKPS